MNEDQHKSEARSDHQAAWLTRSRPKSIDQSPNHGSTNRNPNGTKQGSSPGVFKPKRRAPRLQPCHSVCGSNVEEKWREKESPPPRPPRPLASWAARNLRAASSAFLRISPSRCCALLPLLLLFLFVGVLAISPLSNRIDSQKAGVVAGHQLGSILHPHQSASAAAIGSARGEYVAISRARHLGTRPSLGAAAITESGQGTYLCRLWSIFGRPL